MMTKLFQTAEYKTLIKTHILQSIEYLFKQNQEFALACDIKHLSFNPELPSEIKESFDDTVLFVLSGYTFESASIDKKYFSFEAGFGVDNYGSTVTVPLLAIQQVFVGDNPIVFNWGKYEGEEAEKPAVTSTSKNSAKSSSMEALLKNPENKKLLRKNKS
ncbi:MAG: hypothetical protein GQ531_10830 [Sulfurovum sp.]|nr:hypothetical protein [Sulfurovum sp.]